MRKGFKVKISILIVICIVAWLYWATDTKLEIPIENISMYITKYDVSNQEITESGMREDIINRVKKLKVRRNLFGEYLKTDGFHRAGHNILITIRENDNPGDRYEIYLLDKGRSFISIPKRGKFIIEDKEEIVDYIENDWLDR